MHPAQSAYADAVVRENAALKRELDGLRQDDSVLDDCKRLLAEIKKG
jgi:hypothetical protein